jgi:spore cortex protein
MSEGVFRLIKKQWMIPLSALLTIGLAGCANDDQAGGEKNRNDNALPMGYYSNENHKSNKNGWPADNDGPLPEAMDHTLGLEHGIANENTRRQMQVRNENGNPQNPTTPLAKEDRNFFQHDNRFSSSDANYHGHLNQRRLNVPGTDTTNPEAQDRVTDQIRSKAAAVDNVQQVRSVLYGNDVIVYIEVNDGGRSDETKKAVQTAVKPYANGKNIRVITDDGALGRDRNHHNGEQHLDHNGDR